MLIDEYKEITPCAEEILRKEEFKELFSSQKYEIKAQAKFCQSVAKGRLIDQKLRTDFSTKEAKISLAKERMAIAAFSSDAGWYFMVGDEKLSTVTKRPFVQTDGKPFGGEEDMHDVSLSDTMPRFVKSINETFKNLRESSNKFWVEMFYLHEKKGMCFIRHLSGNQLPADVVVVNLRSEAGYSMRDIRNIMDTIRGYASLPKDTDITDRNLRFYFVN